MTKTGTHLDWTMDETGASNSSQAFETLVNVVDLLIRSHGTALLNGNSRHVARLIMAQLAHKHHLAPSRRTPFESLWRGVSRKKREAIRDAIEKILEEDE